MQILIVSCGVVWLLGVVFIACHFWLRTRTGAGLLPVASTSPSGLVFHDGQGRQYRAEELGRLLAALNAGESGGWHRSESYVQAGVHLLNGPDGQVYVSGDPDGTLTDRLLLALNDPPDYTG